MAAMLLAAALALPAAQQPAPPNPPDFSLHNPASVEAVPRRPPAPNPAPCEPALCGARLIGELWKKGGVELRVTPFSW